MTVSNRPFAEEILRFFPAALSVVCFTVASYSPGQASSVPDSVGFGLTNSYRYFDQPINPDIYLMRPGDELVVSFIKAKLLPLTLVVDPEGKVIDATLGVFDFSHKTLSEAKETLRKPLRELYNVDEIVISVTGPSKVSIAVSGAVQSPGLYTSYTSQRVSEIIDSAGGVLAAGSRRWIVFSGGPQDIIVDLDRADYLGDNTANPCLYAGNSVYVPSKSDELVQVVGEVNNPREIELLLGDDLKLLLALAGGVRSHADIGAIQIIGSSIQGPTQEKNIEADDIIFVPAKTGGNESGRVIAFGAVNKPGKYEYQEGMTLEQLIRQAGGFAPHANSGRTTVFRRAEVDEWGRTTNIRYPISSVVKSNTIFEAMFLRPADSIFVPVKVGYVKVSGEVRNPGLFPFLEGGTAMSYVNAAGGFLPTAEKNRINIYNRVSRITSSLSPEVLVLDGDEVIVNVREEYK